MGRGAKEKERVTKCKETEDVCFGTRWRIEKSRPEEEEAEGEYCFDLIVCDGEGACRLHDVARSEELAEKLLKAFAEGGVTPLEAPYILEDLMTDPEWID